METSFDAIRLPSVFVKTKIIRAKRIAVTLPSSRSAL